MPNGGRNATGQTSGPERDHLQRPEYVCTSTAVALGCAPPFPGIPLIEAVAKSLSTVETHTGDRTLTSIAAQHPLVRRYR